MALLDQQPPHPSTVPFAAQAARTGAIVALALVVYNLVIYLAGLNRAFMENTSLSLLNNLITFGAYFWLLYSALQTHRREDLGGYLSAGRGAAYGAIVGVVSGAITAVWMLVFINYIAPGLLDEIKTVVAQQMSDRGLDEEQVEKQMEMSAFFFKPTGMAIMGFIFSVFMGALAGSIAGLILRKKQSTTGM